MKKGGSIGYSLSKCTLRFGQSPKQGVIRMWRLALANANLSLYTHTVSMHQRGSERGQEGRGINREQSSDGEVEEEMWGMTSSSVSYLTMM